jgi:hypothetical protein
LGRGKKPANPGEVMGVRTSVILSPHVQGILKLLLEARFVSSQSEGADKIIGAWEGSDRGKKTLAEAEERIKNGWNPFG